MQDISNYQSMRETAESLYKTMGHVRCPALDDVVHFNAEGFNHLIYKGDRKERNKIDQITKFKLLSKAKTIIEISSTYQEYDESMMQVKKKRRKKIVIEPATVKYWGFVAIIQGIRVKTIVRRIGNGQKHFWSVIPAWSKSQYRDITFINRSKGDLTED